MVHTSGVVTTVDAFGLAPHDAPEVYPGRWPDGAVEVDGDLVRPIEDPLDPDRRLGRVQVVALGSNACPAQIRRKKLRDPVYLVPTVLRNHLVVYAGHVSRYGVIPATVVRWPGASCQVFSMWLTDAQQSVLDLSEQLNYQRVMLPTDDGLLGGYRANSGHLVGPDRRPVRMVGVTADGPGLPQAMSQLEVRDLRARATA